MVALNSNILKDTRTLINLYQKNIYFRERFDIALKKDVRIAFKGRPVRLYLEVLASVQSPNNIKYKHLYKEALKIRQSDSEGLIGKTLKVVTGTDLIHIDQAIKRNNENLKALEYSDEETDKINQAEDNSNKRQAHEDRLKTTSHLKAPETPEEKQQAEEILKKEAGLSPDNKKNYQPSTEEEKQRLEKALNLQKQEEVPQGVLVDLQGRPLTSKQPEEQVRQTTTPSSLPQTPGISEARGYLSKTQSAREFLANPSWGKFKAIFTGGGRAAAEEVVVGVTGTAVVRAGVTVGAERAAGGFAARLGARATATRTALASAGKAAAMQVGKLAAATLAKVGIKVAASAIAGALTGGASLIVQGIIILVTDPKMVANVVKNLFKWIALIVIGIFFLLYFSTDSYRGTKMSSMIPPYALSGTPISIGGPSVSPGPIPKFSIVKKCPSPDQNAPNTVRADWNFPYIIEVTNLGPGNLTATVTDPLQPQLEFRSCIPDECTLDKATNIVTWKVQNLPPGQKKEISIYVRSTVDNEWVWNYADMGIVSGRSNTCLMQIGTPTGTPPPAPTPTPRPIQNLDQCVFIRAGSSNSFMSPILISWLKSAAAISGIPPTILMGIAYHENPQSSTFTDTSSEIINNSYCPLGTPFCEYQGKNLHMGVCNPDTDPVGSQIGRAVGLMQILDIYNPGVDLCNLQTNISLGASILKGKMGSGSWENENDVKKAVCAYFGSNDPNCNYGGGLYGQEVWDDYVKCISIVTPTPPINETDLQDILAWAKEIGLKLQVGFESLYNKLITDLTNGMYKTGTYPSYSEGTLYWCTYLIIDAYNLAGFGGLNKNDHAAVTNMRNWWKSSQAAALGYKYIDYSIDKTDKTSLLQVKPGYAVFMEKEPGVFTKFEHVAMVTDIKIDKDTGNGWIDMINSNGFPVYTLRKIVTDWVIQGTIYPVDGFGGR